VDYGGASREDAEKIMFRLETLRKLIFLCGSSESVPTDERV